MFGNGTNGISPEAEYLYEKARQKVDEGEYQHAITDLNKAIEICPHFSQAFYELGVCFENTNMFDDAISSYRKAVQIDPSHADAWFNKGMSLKKIGQEEESYQCVERAIELYCGR